MLECTPLIIHAKQLFASYLLFARLFLMIASGSCNLSAFFQDNDEAKRFEDNM